MSFNKNKNLLFFFFLIFVSLILILGNNFGVVRFFRGGIEKVIVPLKSVVYQTKNLADPKEGEEEAKKLANLENEVAVLKKENESMKKLLNIPLPPAWQYQMAKVVGYSSFDIQIDKGQKEGVKEGMAVVVDNFLIGKVVWSGEHLSRVILPVSSEGKVLAVARSSEGDGKVKAKGIVYGYGQKMVLEKVLTSEVINEGDIVSTAGDENLPADLIIGKLGKINNRVGEVYQNGEIKPSLDFGKLEIVFVVIER
ncbi:MAG: rod shape-determining protein MreC [Patescibacteria group bacterium]|nr:rod shape-determining protein MreC [Patescibacteria group bacterium]